MCIIIWVEYAFYAEYTILLNMKYVCIRNMDSDMKVVCANPYLVEFIEFPIVLTSRFSKKLYMFVAFTKKRYITRHNAKEKAILLHMNYGHF